MYTGMLRPVRRVSGVGCRVSGVGGDGQRVQGVESKKGCRQGFGVSP